LFDTFAILDIWSYAQPEQCRFHLEKHGASGDKIPKAIHEKIEKELFIAEDFEASALTQAEASASLADFIRELQEPAISGQHCIPWLGEVAAKEHVLHLCAAGKLAINVRGLELLQPEPGEGGDTAWMRIKGKLGSGKDLEQTTLLTPGATNQSGGAPPPVLVTTGAPPVTQTSGPLGLAPNPFEQPGPITPRGPTSKLFGTPPKTPVNLLGEIEKWGIAPATNVANVNINVTQMTGAQLTELLKKLPDGVNYSLNLEKEAQ
jgi:hypothetical protein